MSEQPDKRPTCDSCPWWVPIDKLTSLWRGDCHHGSPSTDPETARAFRSGIWPTTSADDWCGEHPGRMQVVAAELVECKVLTEADLRRVLSEEFSRIETAQEIRRRLGA